MFNPLGTFDQKLQEYKDIEASLFKNLPPEMKSFYEDQKYIDLGSAAAPTPGAVTRVVYAEVTSGPAPHPIQTVYLPPGFVVTGGGVRANWHVSGSLLTASFPLLGSIHGWCGQSKDHGVSEPCTITIWAIGIEIVGIKPS